MNAMPWGEFFTLMAQVLIAAFVGGLSIALIKAAFKKGNQ